MGYTDFKEVIEHTTHNLPMRVYHSGTTCSHWHDEYEWLIADGGVCECTVQATRYLLQAGHALLVHGSDLHSIRCTGGRCFAIVFHPSVVCGNELSDFLAPNVRFQCTFSPGRPKEAEILARLYKICQLSNAEFYGFELQMKALITEIIGKLYEYKLYRIDAPEQKSRDTVAKLLKYTAKHCTDVALSIETVAQHFHFSRSYVSQLFRKHTDRSFCDYRNDCRIEKAIEWLTTTDKSILEISELCGFENVNYFIRVFKMRQQTTPHQYRKNNT